MSTWDPARTAEFFDEYGEREWTRFEDGRTPGPSLTTHLRILEGYVRRGDRALDAGSGPGRFTLILVAVRHAEAFDDPRYHADVRTCRTDCCSRPGGGSGRDRRRIPSRV